MSRKKSLFAIIDEIRKGNSGSNPDDIIAEAEEKKLEKIKTANIHDVSFQRNINNYFKKKLKI